MRPCPSIRTTTTSTAVRDRSAITRSAWVSASTTWTHGRPAARFYRFAAGGWLDQAVIPDEDAQVGGFIGLFHLLNEQILSLLQNAADQSADEPEGTIVQQVGDLFASAMDVERLEALGFDPTARPGAHRGHRRSVRPARRACPPDPCQRPDDADHHRRRSRQEAERPEPDAALPGRTRAAQRVTTMSMGLRPGAGGPSPSMWLKCLAVGRYRAW
ncbi:MAG: hypothetical protein H6649_15350 [Caldilineae bacterium]|nr:hypothetical protein [Caldilineae bacterium]